MENLTLVSFDFPYAEIGKVVVEHQFKDFDSRTNFFQYYLKQKKYSFDTHEITDFVVESVVRTKKGEIWVIGS
jgi:hypothetical protein